MKDNTIIQHGSENRRDNHGAVVAPIYQNSLFTFESWEAIDNAFSNPADHYIYTRGNNPTAEQVERKLAALARGEKAKLFASGMGAISAAIMSCVKQGDHIIAVKNTYGPASNFMGTYLRDRWGVEVDYVEGKQVSEFSDKIKKNTALIYLESPSSVVMSLQDLEKIAELAKKHGITTIADNTWATFLFQKPLTLGIDIEVHSCSKYIGGHSDVVAGVVISSTERINSIIYNEAALFGAKIAPYEAWLLQRSLRTMPFRLQVHQQNTLAIVQLLERCSDKIAKVYHPAAQSYDQKELASKQMMGTTGLLAFDLKTKDLAKIKAFVNKFKYFSIGVGWGGHESLVYAPAISYLKEMTPDKFEMLGITLGSIRLSIGLEDVEDLKEDILQALAEI